MPKGHLVEWEKRTQNEPKTNPIKANLLNAQMNVNKVLTKDYENKSNWAICENEPKTNPIRTQTNPIKANFQKAQMNVNKVFTKDYENKSNWAIFENKANTNPIQSQTKPISEAKRMLLLMTINPRPKPCTSPTTGPWREFVFDIGGTLRHKVSTG